MKRKKIGKKKQWRIEGNKRIYLCDFLNCRKEGNNLIKITPKMVLRRCDNHNLYIVYAKNMHLQQDLNKIVNEVFKPIDEVFPEIKNGEYAVSSERKSVWRKIKDWCIK